MICSNINCVVFAVFLYFLHCDLVSGNRYVSHFEYLSYNTDILNQQHERSRRSVSNAEKLVELQFQSHGRPFYLQMVPDKTVFHPDVVIESRKEGLDTSHIYHGILYGKKNSFVHGSIINGIFRGVIKDPDHGKYYVEENLDFFGGSRGQSPLAGYRGHSVVYHESAVRMPHGNKYTNHEHCAATKSGVTDRMLKLQNSSIHQDADEPHSRMRRELDDTKTTCLLYIQTDHTLYKEYSKYSLVQEKILSVIAEHVKAVNEIYRNTVFTTSSGQNIRNINFKVQRIRINDTEDAADTSNPFRFPNIGVEKYLDIVSMANHNDYCLAYVFSNRDFDNGVLGLAWVGSSSGTSGGICEKYKAYSDGSSKSLNTGLVTFQNYGSTVPSKVSHITFAHELGHNFGSPHDMGADCTPGESSSISLRTQGNYIMYARATSGKEPNNNHFSGCSIRNISKVLETKKDRCFVRSDEPICGNQIIDDDSEECDCGYTDTCRDKLKDTCCTPADDPNVEMRCKLKAGAQCSKTQGFCCTDSCQFKDSSQECSAQDECRLSQNCNGMNATCPPAVAVDGDVTPCMHDTQVCQNGECTGSICLIDPSLEECECTVPTGTNNRSQLCHTCCQLKGNTSSCRSTGDRAFHQIFNSTVIFLQPGSACENFQGYCDVFSKCRSVDADGPLSRLKQAILNPELYSTIREWIVAYWWAVLLMTLALVLLFAGFIKLCSVHTPSNNPTLPKHRQLPGADTLRRRRTARSNQHQQQQQRRRRPQQRGYEMSNRSERS
ncbi:disintegrin and metalloproteinase domain-containing protein 10-like [Clavelina lepadiformis]|uniref:disintegrin and metalloproteinase domain-containing protein 10-like n=1 Tax=Clavelina lepadiformis TaxID=159417 RepID=UPI004042A66D